MHAPHFVLFVQILQFVFSVLLVIFLDQTIYAIKLAFLVIMLILILLHVFLVHTIATLVQNLVLVFPVIVLKIKEFFQMKLSVVFL